MPLVTSGTIYEGGDVPTAAGLNAPYDDAATVSNAIAGDNTTTGWLTLKHCNTAAPVANVIYDYANDTTTQTTYNSTSYTTITQGGNPAQITINTTPDVGEIIRFTASGIVGDNEVATDYDFAGLPGGNKGKPNYYAFRLLLNHTTGGTPGTIVLGEWGYSFTTKKSGTLTSTISNPIAGAINWQTFQFSACYRQDQTRLLNNVQLQCKVFDNTNTLHIERHQLFAVRAKR
tara:strand:- start:44 stop:736 length:693 start_codon:yes stop_codon:yes gene_type:complete